MIVIVSLDIDICVFVCMYKYVCVHNEFMYILSIHINSRIYYLRFMLIYLINSDDKILTITN